MFADVKLSLLKWEAASRKFLWRRWTSLKQKFAAFVMPSPAVCLSRSSLVPKPCSPVCPCCHSQLPQAARGETLLLAQVSVGARNITEKSPNYAVQSEKLPQVLHLAWYTLTGLWGFPANRLMAKDFAGWLCLPSWTKSHVPNVPSTICWLLPCFLPLEWFLWLVEIQFIIDFVFLKFNFFSSSPLMINEKRTGIFVFLLQIILTFTLCKKTFHVH